MLVQASITFTTTSKTLVETVQTNHLTFTGAPFGECQLNVTCQVNQVDHVRGYARFDGNQYPRIRHTHTLTHTLSVGCVDLTSGPPPSLPAQLLRSTTEGTTITLDWDDGEYTKCITFSDFVVRCQALDVNGESVGPSLAASSRDAKTTATFSGLHADTTYRTQFLVACCLSACVHVSCVRRMRCGAS